MEKKAGSTKHQIPDPAVQAALARWGYQNSILRYLECPPKPTLSAEQRQWYNAFVFLLASKYNITEDLSDV